MNDRLYLVADVGEHACQFGRMPHRVVFVLDRQFVDDYRAACAAEKERERAETR